MPSVHSRWMAARIEAAVPAPGIFPGRHAGAERDHADPHVAVIDVPAFFTGIERVAAGELGDAPLKRGPDARTIPLPIGAWAPPATSN